MTCVTFTYSRLEQTSGFYVHKCTVSTTWLLSTSDQVCRIYRLWEAGFRWRSRFRKLKIRRVASERPTWGRNGLSRPNPWLTYYYYYHHHHHHNNDIIISEEDSLEATERLRQIWFWCSWMTDSSPWLSDGQLCKELLLPFVSPRLELKVPRYTLIQGVTGGTDQTSGGVSLC